MEAYTHLNGKWKLENSASDEIGPFLKEMGAPWIAQKAANSASPTIRLTVTLSGKQGLEVKNYGLLMSSKHFYALGEASTHVAQDGSKCPARLELNPDGSLSVSISHARGDILQSYMRVGEDMHCVIALSRGGVEVLRMRRVNKRVAE